MVLSFDQTFFEPWKITMHTVNIKFLLFRWNTSWHKLSNSNCAYIFFIGVILYFFQGSLYDGIIWKPYSGLHWEVKVWFLVYPPLQWVLHNVNNPNCRLPKILRTKLHTSKPFALLTWHWPFCQTFLHTTFPNISKVTNWLSTDNLSFLSFPKILPVFIYWIHFMYQFLSTRFYIHVYLLFDFLSNFNV